MPLQQALRKVMVIGSGPIVIGQAAEFDYAGTQACRALKEEGIEVVLVNSNPATIMTDANIADRVYLEPLVPDVVAGILRREQPDGIIASLGGQVGLNMALALERMGVLRETGIPLLGTPLDAIQRAEDRDLFKQTMQEIGEPVPESTVVEDVEAAVAFAARIGYPVIVRPAFTLGGTGGGFAHDEQQLRLQAAKGLKMSVIRQLLIERSVSGWKEVEFEVMRDASGTCITICSMENVDPMGVHTGDSIVVAPALTLNDREYQMLRTASLKIINRLGIAGGCNVQFALDPATSRYYVIEVNPRVSRSSALASKATGYPIARVTTKIAVGYRLDEIVNRITGSTSACFEPSIDYVVVKIPRWPFDKFVSGDRRLGTQMKATGEVMAIDRSFEAALLKGVRSLEQGTSGLLMPEMSMLEDDELCRRLREPDDQRLFVIAEALRRGMTVERIQELSRIDAFFLRKMQRVVEMATRLGKEELSPDLLRQAKRMGFADAEIAALRGVSEGEVRACRRAWGIVPTYKMVDTCAAEFEAQTPYFYSTCEREDEAACQPDRRRVLVVGAGPIRIGQGVEFDYCSVHCVWALREAGVEAIIVNNNPETVSTDFDTSDRLYFEPLAFEDVMNVIDEERPEGAIVQFGGQTAINLARPLQRAGVPILGTSCEDIDRAENRDLFDALLESLGIARPPGGAATSVEEGLQVGRRVGFPALVRPSYVLGGRAMEIVDDEQQLAEYMRTAVMVSPEHPVLVDRYLVGDEIEVDAVCDGETVLIPGIMQHVERAGVHSGDSIAVYPAYSLGPRVEAEIIDVTTRLARALNVRGLLNIQFVLHEGRLCVLEVNPRSSRTVPFLSKVTGIPMVKLATEVMLGKTLHQLGYQGGLQAAPPFFAVKVPVFSFSKLSQVDISLGPEMKSTGEVMGIDACFEKALHKGFLAAGVSVPESGVILATVADRDKEEAIPILRGFYQLGFSLLATAGTARALEAAGMKVERVNKLGEGSPTIVDLIRQDRVDMVVNTLTRGRQPASDGFQIRRAAVELGIACLTSLDTARAMLRVVQDIRRGKEFGLMALQEYLARAQK